MQFVCLIPFYIEIILIETTKNGNMGLHGLYLSLYYKRNLVYVSTLFLIISYFLPYFGLFSIGLFVFSVYSYITCKLWKFIHSPRVL